jgi:hypothetical protein
MASAVPQEPSSNLIGLQPLCENMLQKIKMTGAKARFRFFLLPERLKPCPDTKRRHDLRTGLRAGAKLIFILQYFHFSSSCAFGVEALLKEI